MKLRLNQNVILSTVILFLVISASIKINAQEKVIGDALFYVKDSCLYQFNFRNDSIKPIYYFKNGERLVDYDVNWKQGILIAIENSYYSYIVKMSNSNIQFYDTICKILKSDGEPFQIIASISVSPTGDFMVIKMGYWESNGIEFYDFKKGSFIRTIDNGTYLSDFIKWLPFNSALVTHAEGSEIDGPGELKIYNINLENRLFKFWMIPNTIYEGFFEYNGNLSIICTPNDAESMNSNGLRLNAEDLSEISDRTLGTKSKFNDGNHEFEVILDSLGSSFFSLRLMNLKDSKAVFSKKYKLEYPQIDWFEFDSINFDSRTNTIIIKFNVSLTANKVSRLNIGSVSYCIDLSGQLIKRAYNNVNEYRQGFNVERYENIFIDDGIITKLFVNDKYSKTLKRNISSRPIPKEILK